VVSSVAIACGPFVRVNCAALPEQLLESELFCHEKGSFTGADRTRIGRFEHANGGTVFLDEVADMSRFTQGKVLRVIQEKEFVLFREDLFFRLNVVAIRLPPLRERNGDIALLIQFFLKSTLPRWARRSGASNRGR
jgi:transcriptional regulator with PAS, ATPase and Fis domain